MDETKVIGTDKTIKPPSQKTTTEKDQIETISLQGVQNNLSSYNNKTEPEFKDLVPGDEIDGYIVESLIGQGGMGKVYKVKDPLTEKVAALKTLSLSSHMNPEEREVQISRFTNEAQIMWQLFDSRIPNVPHIFHMPKNPLGIIMELLPGTTVEDYLERGKIKVTSLQRINLLIPLMAKVASTLYQAHKIGIIHRDLKPENIMVQKRNTENELIPILVDFGIAKNPEKNLTTSQSLMGTPSYMSPEQLTGKTAQVDGRSDIFSFGMVLFTILSGKKFYTGLIDNRLPFFERIMAQVALLEEMKTSTGPAFNRLQLIPEGFRQIIERCIAFDPDDRYENMNEVEKSLMEVTSPTDLEYLNNKTVSDTDKTIPTPDTSEESTTHKKNNSQLKTIILAGVGILIIISFFLLSLKNTDSKDTQSLKAPKIEISEPTKIESTGKKSFCKSGTIEERATCLLSVAPSSKLEIDKLINTVTVLQKKGCGTSNKILTNSTCYKLGKWSTNVLGLKCKKKIPDNIPCIFDKIRKKTLQPIPEFWNLLALTLTYCNKKHPIKSVSRNLCIEFEKFIGISGSKIYNLASEPVKKRCLSEKPKYYKNNPGVLMACIKRNFIEKKLNPEIEFLLIQSNYWKFCKSGSRYKRAGKHQCYNEKRNIKHRRLLLSVIRAHDFPKFTK